MPNDSKTTDVLEITKYFWEEYKYRHDHIWQRIIRFTVAIVLISIMPYIQQDIIRILKYGVLMAPVLAFLLACFIFMVMKNELALFGKIKKAYQYHQNKFFDKELVHDTNKQTTFAEQVKIYFGTLVLLTIINGFMVWFIWIPKVLALPCN